MASTTTTTREGRIATAAAALGRHADPGPTALASMTDEQLLVLHGPTGSEHLLTPWLDRSADTTEQRNLLLSAALRGQIASGAVAPEATLAAVEDREPVGAPDDLVPAALQAGIVGRRIYSRLRVTVTDLDDPGQVSMQIYSDADGSVMLEQISSNGIHHFTMSNVTSAVWVQSVWMLGLPDAEEVFDSPDSGSVHSGFLEELKSVTQLSAALTSPSRRMQVVAEERSEGAEQVLWLVRDEEMLIALQPTVSSTQSPSIDVDPLEAVRVSPEGLRSQLAEFLTIS